MDEDMNKYSTLKQVLDRINSNKDWYNKSYAGYLFGIDEQAMGIACASKNPIALPYGFAFFNTGKKHHWEWFWDNGEIKNKRNIILRKNAENKNFANEFLKKWEIEFNQFIQTYNKIVKSDLNKLSDSELADILEEMHNHYLLNGGHGYIVDAFLTSEEEDWLVKEIKNELEDKASQEIIAKLTQPVFGSFVNEYEVGLLEVAELIKNRTSKDKIDKEISKMVKEFIWIKSNYFDKHPLDSKIILDEASLLANKYINFDNLIKEKLESAENNKKIKNEIYKKYNISDNLKRIIKISEIFTHVQDKRKERVLRTNYAQFKIMDEIALRFDKSNEICYYLTIAEAIKLLRTGKIDWNNIEKRLTEEFAIFYFNGKSEILWREEIEKKINKNNIFDHNQEIKELKGAVAYRGNVKGKVQVLRNSKDIELFKQGNILVANQTTPEFVPAMKKAVAIVTDQGGITCHAAIVSRELKVPCVIGTKIATKILKDGDFIEVDADKGIVRIIK